MAWTPAERPAERRREERDETRRLILHAARGLFLTRGYRAVTTREVAEATGLTHPALYHHFANKEALYVAVLLDEIERNRVALEHIARRAEPVVERLRKVTLVLLARVDYDYALMQHDIASELSPAASAQVGAAFFAGYVEPLAALMAEGQTTGALREMGEDGLDAAGMAGVLLALVAHFVSSSLPGVMPIAAPTAAPDGAAHPAPAHAKSREDVQRTASLIVEVLTRGVGA